MDRLLKGSLYTLAAAIMWGGTPIIEKSALNHMAPIVFGAWRYFLAGVMIFAYLKFRKVDIGINAANGRRLFSASIFGSALLPTFFYYGLFLTDPVTAASVSNTSVLWVGILGAVLLKEKIRRDEIAGTLFVVAGAYVILNKLVFEASLGAIMLVLSSISGALAVVMERKSLRYINPWVVTLYDRLVGGSVTMIASLFLVGAGAIFLSKIAWAYLIFLALFGALIPAVLFFYGLKLIEAERSAAIVSTIPLFTVAFTALFTETSVTQGQFVGALLIVGGVVILSVSRKLVWTMRHYASVAVGRETSGLKKLKQIFISKWGAN